MTSGVGDGDHPGGRDAGPGDPGSARSGRRGAVILAAVMIGLVALLAALPFVASRPRPAPDVTVTTLAGESRSMAALAGRPVLVSFWSTSCSPCMAEMPAKIALHRRHGPAGLATIAIAMPYDTAEDVRRFAAARQLPFDVVLDETGLLAEVFDQTRTTPTKFLIDPAGRIVRIYVGGTDFADLERRIAAMLAG